MLFYLTRYDDIIETIWDDGYIDDLFCFPGDKDAYDILVSY